jgi:hypothetical protein
LFLVLPGTPAAVDEELNPVVRGISCRVAQGTEEGRVEVGYTRNLVIKDRGAVGDDTVSLAKGPTVLIAHTRAVLANTTVSKTRDLDV